MTTSAPVSARFTVAISSASPAIFSSLGWSRRILRADRASARTECPAARAAFTPSSPIPLLAPMIRTVAMASCSRSDPPGSASCAMQAAAPQDGGNALLGPLWSHAARLTWPRNWLARGSLRVADIGGRLTSAASCQTQCRKDVGARKELAYLVTTSAFSQQLAYKCDLGHEAFGIQP